MSFTDFEISEINKVVALFPNGTEISVAKIFNKTPCYYGVKNSENKLNAINNSNKVFEIGSITKVLTSFLLAKKVAEGVIELDQAINTVIPTPIKDGAKITFKELATHTSGLPRLPPGLIWQALFKDKDNPYKNYSNDRLIDYLENKLKLKAKGKMLYSNLGAGLLGYVLSTLSNQPYNELITDNLFLPLGMSNSTAQRELVNNRLVPGLGTKGKPVSNWDLGALQGAGAVLSTTEDLVKFVLANFDSNNEVMKKQRTTAFDDGVECIALGWLILDKKTKGERMYFHNGGTGGYSSAMLLDIEKSNAFIILSNISGLHKLKGQKVDNLALNLMANLMDEKETNLEYCDS